MTDKVQRIREEVEMVVNRRLNLLNGDYFDLNEETNGFTNEIMDIIDSLQEEPVSKEIGDYDHKAVMEALHPELKEKFMNEELEKAAKYCIPDESYHMIIESEEEEGSGENVYDYVQMIEMFKAGAQWQKEEMMVKAIDGEILEVEDNDCAICSHTHLELCIKPDTLEKNGFKDNDKVKVIVIKED